MQSNTRLAPTTNTPKIDITQVLANTEKLVKGSMLDLMQLKTQINRMKTDKWDAEKIIELLAKLPKYNKKKISEFYKNNEFNAEQFLSSTTYTQLTTLLDKQLKEYLEILQALKITPIDDSITAVLIIVKMQGQRHLDDKKGDYIANFSDNTLLAKVKAALTPFISEYYEDFCGYLQHDKNFLGTQFEIDRFMSDKAKERNEIFEQYYTPFDISEKLPQGMSELGLMVIKQNQQEVADLKPVDQLKDFLIFYHCTTRCYLDIYDNYQARHEAYKHYQTCYAKLQQKYLGYFKQLELIALYQKQHPDIDNIAQECLDENRRFSKIYHEMWREKPYTLPSLTDIEKLYQTAVGLFDKQIAAIQRSHGKIMPIVNFVTEYNKNRNLIQQKLIQLKTDIDQKLETCNDSNSYTELTQKLACLYSEFIMLWPENSYSISTKFDLKASYDEMQRRINVLTDALNTITQSIEEKNLREQQELQAFKELQISRKNNWELESKQLKKLPDNMSNANPPVTKKSIPTVEPTYTALSADLAQKIRDLNNGHIKSLWKIMNGDTGLRFNQIQTLIIAMGGTLESPSKGSSHRRVKFLSLMTDIVDTKDDEATSDDETEENKPTPQSFATGIFKAHGKSHNGATQPQLNVKNLRELFLEMGITVEFIDSVLAGNLVQNTTQSSVQNTKGL